MPPVTGIMNAYWVSVSNGISHINLGYMSGTYHPLEVAHDAVETNAEARGFEFLCRGRPFHVDAACVADECFTHVEAKATKEQNELFGC